MTRLIKAITIENQRKRYHTINLIKTLIKGNPSLEYFLRLYKGSNK